MNASGYSLTIQPQVAVGQTVDVTATLTGGTDLDTPLTIALSGAATSFGGPITIDPGSTAGSTTVTPAAGDGRRAVAASHSGGNAGMPDASASFRVVSPTLPPVTGIDFAVYSPPAGYASTWADLGPDYRVGPDGSGYLVSAWPVGGWALPGPLLVKFADDAGGVFLPSWASFGDNGDGEARDGPCLLYYLPRVGGTRVITATAHGAKPGLSVPAPKSVPVVVPAPLTGGFTPISAPPLPAPIAAYTLPPITPAYPRAVGYTAAVVSPPPGYQGDGTASVGDGCRTGPVGVAQQVYVHLTGGPALDAPLVVTLADDAGGLFPGGPATLTGGDLGHAFAVVPYIPMAAGPRTISATCSGGNAGFSNPTPDLLVEFLAT